MPKKPRILCVDDLPDNLRVRIALLEQFGCEAIAVSDCRSALRVLAETTIDLLVIDYHLAAGETGEDLARDVRVINPRMPLIMLTGDSSIPESARESVDAVVLKGTANPRALLDLIEKLVPDAALAPRRLMLFRDPKGVA